MTDRRLRLEEALGMLHAALSPNASYQLVAINSRSLLSLTAMSVMFALLPAQSHTGVIYGSLSLFHAAQSAITMRALSKFTEQL
jgi:hypothetical protein